MANPSNPIDLGALFQTVTGALAQNKDSLNKADTNNHDHGNNMVSAFEMITKAMQEKKSANPADQLAHAAQALSQQKSGSAQLYARGLSQASQKFQGRQVTSDNAMVLVQSLLGVEEAQAQQPAQLMVSPANLSYISGNNIKFQWKAAPGATKYWLSVKKVSDNSTRVSKDLGKVLFSDEPGFPDDGTQYKWAVGLDKNPASDKAAVYWTFTSGTAAEPQQQLQQAQQQKPLPQTEGFGDVIGQAIRKGKPAKPQTEGFGDVIGQAIRKGKPAAQPNEGIGDAIGSLIRKGQQQAQGRQQPKGGFDLGDLLNAGKAFMGGKSGNEGNLDSIVKGVVSNSAMGDSYRSQSGEVVANTLMTAIQNMVSKK
ncbi:MAG: DAK2 domain-containing protein [Dehalococcoidia bacterium]|nr:DAK2 domain-containing protein [Dehalococcoidia bacterium]